MTTWKVCSPHPPKMISDMMLEQSQMATRNASSMEQVSEADLKLGLLAYPVLQTADIMLYK